MAQSRNPQRERLTKARPFEVTKIDGDEGVVEAIVAVMGIIDDGDDIIHTGAFAKTIQERANRIKVLDHHNAWSTRDVVGKLLSIREVDRDELPQQLLEQYPQATGGLLTETQYLMDTEEGRGVFQRIKAGAVSEYSIGFEIIQADYSKIELDGQKKSIRNIRELKLYEFSPVIWGMNPATATVSVKRDDDKAPPMPNIEKAYVDGQPSATVLDCLIGRTHFAMAKENHRLLMDGYLSADEYLALNDIASGVISFIRQAIDPDVATRITSDMMPAIDYYIEMAAGVIDDNQHDIPDELKAAEIETAEEAGPEPEQPEPPTDPLLDEIAALEASLIEN